MRALNAYSADDYLYIHCKTQDRDSKSSQRWLSHSPVPSLHLTLEESTPSYATVQGADCGSEHKERMSKHRAVFGGMIR